MMKITRAATGEATIRLTVEGQVTGRGADELRASCAPHLGASAVLLDLAGVTFIDGVGLDVARDLERRGALLVGCSAFVAELLRSAPVQAPAPAGADEALAAQLRASDDHAFETLVRRHGGRMLATARRLLRHEEEARDAVQEAFLSAFTAIDRFDGRARLSTWLHRIVMNCALMRLRRQRRLGVSELRGPDARHRDDR